MSQEGGKGGPHSRSLVGPWETFVRIDWVQLCLSPFGDQLPQGGPSAPVGEGRFQAQHCVHREGQSA